MKDKNKLLQEIKGLLQNFNLEIENSKFDKITEKLEQISLGNKKESLNSLQTSFNRLHDKLFTFNNLMIAAFIAFSQYPAANPIFRTWYVIVPTLNMIYLIVIEKLEMEKFRFESKHDTWKDAERKKHPELIRNQNLRSLSAITYTVFIFIFLCLSIFNH